MRGKRSDSRAKTVRVISTTGIEDEDLVNFYRPKGNGTIEEVGVISFEPRAPSKTSRVESSPSPRSIITIIGLFAFA